MPSLKESIEKYYEAMNFLAVADDSKDLLIKQHHEYISGYGDTVGAEEAEQAYRLYKMIEKNDEDTRRSSQQKYEAEKVIKDYLLATDGKRIMRTIHTPNGQRSLLFWLEEGRVESNL